MVAAAGKKIGIEITTSYPDWSVYQTVVMKSDYPLISATTLIITLMVLATTFIIEVLYGFIDPRIKSAQSEG